MTKKNVQRLKGQACTYIELSRPIKSQILALHLIVSRSSLWFVCIGKMTVSKAARFLCVLAALLVQMLTVNATMYYHSDHQRDSSLYEIAASVKAESSKACLVSGVHEVCQSALITESGETRYFHVCPSDGMQVSVIVMLSNGSRRSMLGRYTCLDTLSRSRLQWPVVGLIILSCILRSPLYSNRAISFASSSTLRKHADFGYSYRSISFFFFFLTSLCLRRILLPNSEW